METISCINPNDVKIKIPTLVGLKKNQETTIVKVNGVEFGGSKVVIVMCCREPRTAFRNSQVCKVEWS